MSKKILAVDFDGTLVENAYPNIGKIKKEVFAYARKRKNNGWIVTLWTCRTGRVLSAAVDFCTENGLTFDFINENAPDNVAKYGNDTRKGYADEYLDDKNITIEQIGGV